MMPLAHDTTALQRYFTARLGATALVDLEDLRRIAVGHSRAMWVLGVVGEVAGRKIRREYVIRIEQGGVFGTKSEREVRVMRILHAAGHPVAPVRWYEPDASIVGAPFFVMDWINGAGENPSPTSIRDFVRLLKRQHELDWSKLGLAFLGAPSTPRAATLGEIARWEEIYQESRALPVPLLEEAAAWLKRNAPVPGRVCLIHGDPGPGNYLFADDRILAVTDWEFAHLGDPNEDWVFLATIRGASHSKEEWRALLKSEASVEISDEEWLYWDAFNQFKGACANLTALRLFSDGTHPMPNMAAVGTSIHLLMLNRLAELIESS